MHNTQWHEKEQWGEEEGRESKRPQARAAHGCGAEETMSQEGCVHNQA